MAKKDDLIRKHAGTINKAAETGAVAAGLGWWYFLAIFAVILLVIWAVALWIGSLVSIGAAALATIAIAPPLLKEWRRRDEVRASMGRPTKR